MKEWGGNAHGDQAVRCLTAAYFVEIRVQLTDLRQSEVEMMRYLGLILWLLLATSVWAVDYPPVKVERINERVYAMLVVNRVREQFPPNVRAPCW